ncbi:MAG TPA: LysM peptidoglycan-binding domain-containing protein [Arthrobacter sp.]|nr:LysM peptidoglycan-binding domain-containing protein [Arthrobacter sp.]
MSPQRQLTQHQPTSNKSLSGEETQRSRKFGAAVSTAAIPAVVISSLALAQPAQASPSVTIPTSLPSGLATAGTSVGPVQTSVTPSSLVATRIPSFAPMTRKAPSSHTVRSGDTVSSIAARYGLNTHDLLQLNGLRASTIIYPGQKIKLGSGSDEPREANQRQQSRNRGPSNGTSSTYTVKSGDTISSIAARHGKSIREVLNLNGLNLRSIIYPGQKIKLSGNPVSSSSQNSGSSSADRKSPRRQSSSSGASTYTVKSGDTISSIAARHGKSIREVLDLNGLNMRSVIYPGQKIKLSGAKVTTQSTEKTVIKKPGSQKAKPSGSYTVKSGDTLGAIAARHGVSLSSLLQANGMNLGSVIYPGNKLAIPGQGSGKDSSTPKNLVPDTFLGYTYPKHVVASANKNKAALLAAPAPSAAEVQDIIVQTARQMGVPPSLALAHAYQESGFNHRAVSPANAIGTMQVIPSSGEWASQLVGRQLNLLDPYDNITAGVAIIDALLRTSDSREKAIASYYQGQWSVEKNGFYDDTKRYVKSVKALEKKFR